MKKKQDKNFNSYLHNLDYKMELLKEVGDLAKDALCFIEDKKLEVEFLAFRANLSLKEIAKS